MPTLKGQIKINTLAFLAGKGLFLIDKTVKFRLVNYRQDISPVIYAVWHGLQYTFMGIPNRQNISILISKSNDGEFISRALMQRGFSIIRGSHGRGGAEAVRKILKETKKGRCIAYNIDGPRGPAFVAKEGIIKVAQMAKIPIIPVSSDITPCLKINSWDKYEVPLLFSKAVTVFGEPIYVPKGASEDEMEQYRLQVEKDLFALREKACEELRNWR